MNFRKKRIAFPRPAHDLGNGGVDRAVVLKIQDVRFDLMAEHGPHAVPVPATFGVGGAGFIQWPGIVISFAGQQAKRLSSYPEVAISANSAQPQALGINGMSRFAAVDLKAWVASFEE